MPYARGLREKAENALVTASARRLRLPEPVVRFFFPLMVTHFTQRKPYGLGKTARPHPWSFNRPGISFFCCQCGKLQEKLGAEWLVIEPPQGTRNGCIWRLKK